jgi:sugar phosphate isomerase/epimerase
VPGVFGFNNFVLMPEVASISRTPVQADYHAAWERAVASYRALADACAPLAVRVSLEFKPTDEATRWSFVPTTGAALLLGQKVNRSNFGLTLDYGHLVAAGENPAQSVAMVGAAGKLFGLHLNDGSARPGAEDGLVFGGANPLAALELVHWLQRLAYNGTVYFDTFPLKEDPVREAALNVRRFKALWARAAALAAAGVERFSEAHDALGVLELLTGLDEGENSEQPCAGTSACAA